MRIALVLAAMIGMASSGALAQQEERADPSVKPVSLAFDESGLSGPAAETLRAQLPDMQFIMIGEDHGFADAPKLLAAFAAEGAEYGFDDYAIEVGPYSAEWLRRVLASGGPDGLAKQLEGRPLAVPFLTLREEAEAAMPFLEEGRLWGVDQEFIGSPLIHFEILQGGSDPALTVSLLEQEKAAFASGNQAAAFMVRASDADWAALEANFSEDPRALDQIEQLRRSTAVYRANFEGRGLKNNLDRIELIREYFLAAYEAAEARKGEAPRVVMKFGATHASRATTPMNTFDLGPLIEGMAAANGMDAMHIVYLPIGGEKLGIAPSPDGFFAARAVDAGKLRDALEMGGVDLSPVSTGEGHFLIPLEPVKRALGNKGLSEIDRMTRFVILGFDYLVTTADGRPATPLAPK